MRGSETNKVVFSENYLNRFPLLSALMVIVIHMYNVDRNNVVNASTLVEDFFAHGLFTAAVPMFLLCQRIYFLEIFNL